MRVASFTALVEGVRADLSKKAKADHELRLAERPNERMEFKIHEPKFLGDMRRSSTRTPNRQGAVDLVRKALERDVGPNRTEQMMRAAGIQAGASVITWGQLSKLHQAWPAQMEEARVDAIDKWREVRSRAHPGPQAAQVEPGMANILNDPQSRWKKAGAGAGAALIVQSTQEQSGGCVVKFETLSKAIASEDIGKLGNAMIQKTGGALPLQFADACVVQGALPGNQGRQLIERINELKNTSTDKRLDEHINKVPQLGEKREHGADPCLTKMSMVEGVQLDMLPVVERVALYKSPEFAQQIGQAAVICPMFGLTDHLAPQPVREGGYRVKGNGAQGSSQNTGNLMINDRTGKLTVIDYSAETFDFNNDNSDIRGFRGVDQTIALTTSFMEKVAANPEELDKAVGRILRDGPAGDNQTPLSLTFGAMTSGVKVDTFFRPDEINYVNGMISNEDRVAFAKNMLKGAAQGLQFIHQNLQQFAEGYRERSEVAVAAGRLDQGKQLFMTEASLGNIQNCLHAVDLNKIVANMNEMVPDAVHVPVRLAQQDAPQAGRHQRAGSIGADLPAVARPGYGASQQDVAAALGKLKSTKVQ